MLIHKTLHADVRLRSVGIWTIRCNTSDVVLLSFARSFPMLSRGFFSHISTRSILQCKFSLEIPDRSRMHVYVSVFHKNYHRKQECVSCVTAPVVGGAVWMCWPIFSLLTDSQSTCSKLPLFRGRDWSIEMIHSIHLPLPFFSSLRELAEYLLHVLLIAPSLDASRVSAVPPCQV